MFHCNHGHILARPSTGATYCPACSIRDEKPREFWARLWAAFG